MPTRRAARKRVSGRTAFFHTSQPPSRASRKKARRSSDRTALFMVVALRFEMGAALYEKLAAVRHELTPGGVILSELTISVGNVSTRPA